MSAMAAVTNIVQRLFQGRVEDFDFTPLPEPPRPKTEEELAVERMRIAILHDVRPVPLPLSAFVLATLVAYKTRKGMRPCRVVAYAGKLITLCPLDAPHRSFTRRWSSNRRWVIAP